MLFFDYLIDFLMKLRKLKKISAKKFEFLETLNVEKKKLIIYYKKTSDIYDYFFNLAIILNSLIRKILYQIINLSLLFITNILFTVFYKIQAEMTDMMNI